jgi:S-formylglutathione hydrolase FrmB
MIACQQFVLLCHGRLLQSEATRRNPATDNGGQHDGDINLRVLINCGPTAGDTPIYNYSRDTLDASDQKPNHAFHRLTQRTLHNSFSTTTTVQRTEQFLKKR